VLVGLPGSGKSTVGPILAARLGWRYADLDREVEREAGRSIADLFHAAGESAFRAMEARLTLALSSLPELVLSTGGGWAAQPGLLEALPPGSAVVWLRVSTSEALRRLQDSHEQRPLLAVPDPGAALDALAGQRTHRYSLADCTVDVDGRDASAVAEEISTWLERSTS
jgi:shikimate kinase